MARHSLLTPRNNLAPALRLASCPLQCNPRRENVKQQLREREPLPTPVAAHCPLLRRLLGLAELAMARVNHCQSTACIAMAAQLPVFNARGSHGQPSLPFYPARLPHWTTILTRLLGLELARTQILAEPFRCSTKLGTLLVRSTLRQRSPTWGSGAFRQSPATSTDLLRSDQMNLFLLPDKQSPFINQPHD